MHYFQSGRHRAQTCVGSRSRIFRRHANATVIVLSFTAVLVLPNASFASSQPAKKLSLLQQGKNYYVGKTLTFITGGPVGTGSDEEARLLVPAMESYLHATIDVENLPTANTLPAQDALAAAPHNGLTFGELDLASDVALQATDTLGLNFNPIRLDFIGAWKSPPYVWIASSTSSITWKTIEDASTPTSMLDTLTGAGNLVERVTNGIFGIKANYVTGYSSTGVLLAGFERGDASVAEANISAGPNTLILARQARPILVSWRSKSSAALTAALQGVPTLAQVAQENPPKTKAGKKALATLLNSLDVEIVSALPTKTPADLVLALQAAFKYASLDKALYPQQLSLGDVPGWISAAAIKADWVSGSKSIAEITGYLNG